MPSNGQVTQLEEASSRDPKKRQYGWSAAREKEGLDEKRRMAKHFVDHDFLTKPALGTAPSDERENAALVMVTLGTTPNAVVKASVEWMYDEWDDRGPFNVCWYTPGARVASTLRNFREEDQATRSAADLFLLPGQVDHETEGVLGDVPVRFVEESLGTTGFKHIILSAYSFDLDKGVAKFRYRNEISLQRACALRSSEHTFLFIDPSKFRSQGEDGYTIQDMLDSSRSRMVTLYTVSSESNDFIRRGFSALWDRVAESCNFTRADNRLRLCIVGRVGEAPEVLPALTNTEVSNGVVSECSKRITKFVGARRES